MTANQLSSEALTGLEVVIETAMDAMLKHPECFAYPFATFFDGAPEGDFRWECEEAGEWMPERVGFDQWEENAYGTTVARQHGVELVEFVQCDRDGNWETVGGRQSDEPTDDVTLKCFMQEAIKVNSTFFLLRVALYQCFCVRHGRDPLKAVFDDWDGSKRIPANSDKIREVQGRNLTDDVEGLARSVAEGLDAHCVEIPRHLQPYAPVSR